MTKSTNSSLPHGEVVKKTLLAKTFDKENSQQLFTSMCRPEKKKEFTFMGWSRDCYGGKLFQKVSSRVSKERAIKQGILPGERI